MGDVFHAMLCHCEKAVLWRQIILFFFFFNSFCGQVETVTLINKIFHENCMQMNYWNENHVLKIDFFSSNKSCVKNIWEKRKELILEKLKV